MRVTDSCNEIRCKGRRFSSTGRQDDLGLVVQFARKFLAYAGFRWEAVDLSYSQFAGHLADVK